MWQVCPMCKGSGQALTVVNMVANSICPVCDGKRVINEATGLPPKDKETSEPSITFPPIGPVTCKPVIEPYFGTPIIDSPSYKPIVTCEQTDKYNPTGHTGDFWK